MNVIEMIKERSKFGIVLVGLYVLLVIWVIYEAMTCIELACGLIISLPIIPWSLLPLWNFFPQNVVLVRITLIPLFLLNGLILYFVGYGIEKLFRRYFKSSSEQSRPQSRNRKD